MWFADPVNEDKSEVSVDDGGDVEEAGGDENEEEGGDDGGAGEDEIDGRD